MVLGIPMQGRPCAARRRAMVSVPSPPCRRAPDPAAPGVADRPRGEVAPGRPAPFPDAVAKRVCGVRGAEDGAATGEDARHVVVGELPGAVFDKPGEPVMETRHGDAVVVDRGLDHRPDGGVEAWAVAPRSGGRSCARGVRHPAPARRLRGGSFDWARGKTRSRSWDRSRTNEKESERRRTAGISTRSLRFFSGRMTRFRPALRAARTFSFTPPTGRTFPASVSSPLIAVSEASGRPASSETSAAAMATPAEGPSFGIAPAGTWMCRSLRSKKSGGSPSRTALERT